ESSADKDKLVESLNRLKREDPTFAWRVDRETGQTLMSGMGMLHLDIKKERLERDFRLKVRVGKPRVSYRETLKRTDRAQGECVKHAAASGLFAKVTVELEPFHGDQPVVVVNRVQDEAVPVTFLAAAEQGIRGALLSGDLGFPVINVRATILDAKL